MSRLKVTQVRSAVDRGARQRGTIRALGIKRMGDSVVHEDRPEIRGMIRAVRHLVVVEEVNGGGSGDEER
jgi:large subunit ribosomal protein L30